MIKSLVIIFYLFLTYGTCALQISRQNGNMKDKQLDNSQRSKLQTVLQRDQLHSKSFNSLFRDISATSKSHSFGLKNNIKHVNRKTDREGKILDHKEKSVNTTDNIKNCKSDQVRANFRRKYPSVSKKALRSERRQHKFGILASDSTSMLKADFQNGYGTMDSEGITDHKQVQNIHGMETAEIAPLIITSKTFSDSNSFDDDIINRKPYIIPNQQHGVSQLKEPSHMMNELELGRIKQQVKPGILNKIMIRGGEGHGSGYMTRKYNYYYEISNPVIEIPPHVRVIDTVATEVSLDERNHNFAISMSDFAMPILAFNFLQNAVRIYSNVLQTHPLPVKMITAGLIGGLGDMLVQLISQKRMKQPFSLRRCLVFMAVCTFYNAPVVHYWFNLLGSIGSKLTNLSDLGRALSLTFIDQTIGAIVLNSGFYFAFELIQRCFPPWYREAHTSVIEAGMLAISKNLASTVVACWSYWPAIIFMTFLWIPSEYRVLAQNLASVFWNMFMSTKANS